MRMPRWVRFLSCSLSGAFLSLCGFLAVASWWEGGSRFWSGLIAFIQTPAFWNLALLFGLLSALALLLARAVVGVYGLPGGLAGLAAGGMVALAYATFLLSTQAYAWGGPETALQKAWPAGPLFAAPFAAAGALTAWLWDRMD